MAKPPPRTSLAADASCSPAVTPLAPGSSKTPARTDPLAEAQRGAWFESTDAITGLREYDGADSPELVLPREVQRATIGASRSCDISLSGRGLSATHCLVERRGDRLRLLDQHSTNGMYFHDRRVHDISIAPGDVFTLVPVTLFALNDEMREHRPTIVDVIGSGLVPSPDKLLIEAARGSSNLILTGEADCDQDRLARAIHAVSLRRRQRIVEITELPEDRAKQREILDSAARSTLVMPIPAGQRPFDPTFCSMVCSPTYHVRVIVLAPSIDAARNALGRDAIDQMQHVRVRPLALRSTQIDRLLDRMFAERHAQLRAADLTPANLAALRAYSWPDNLAGLRRIADELLAHATHHGLRPAARSLGIPTSTLHSHLVGVGLSFPLFAV
jgi:FHA domain